MRILLVYPEYPETFWSFKHALGFISKKASLPPLGLLTVAALLPGSWEKRLADLNVGPLRGEDIEWCDYVFISAMSAQRASARKVIDRCRELGARIVAGGPLFTSRPEEFDDVDHLVLNEGEVTLPLFLEDLSLGRPQHIYTSDERPLLSSSPRPLWELIDKRRYATMCIQCSRGCPFDCDFCDVTSLFGRRIRTKATEQILAELEGLYERGWSGAVFVVDDNFIACRQVKKRLLPAIIEWQRAHGRPFEFNTQASINLADDDELLRLMVEAGFSSVFIGIETPCVESLAACGKKQNVERDLLESVKKIQHAGLEVQGGFIIGFDSDPPSIFGRMIDFIQQSGIVTAMVGLLNAPRGTRLYRRLEDENRLLQDMSGNNTDGSINFTPKMNLELLQEGYRAVLAAIYAPKNYYQRVLTLLRSLGPVQKRKGRISACNLKAFARSVWRLGIKRGERLLYWKVVLWSLFRRPRLLPLAVTLAIYGQHFRLICGES